MKPDDSLRSGYESTPYHDQSFREFDLARLLGFAELFALRDPTRPGGALRVLDLGCASGVHLREQAARYPQVRFEGIDFSTAEVEMGQKAVRESGLENVELVQGDLRSFEVDSDAYDLVLCHGVFSWVPDDVKERIFLLGRQALKPDGLAAIAYLTYPGWKQLEAFRELLMMRVSPHQPEAERIRESALLLRLLHASYEAAPNDVHARSLKQIVERMQKSSSNAFLHDELGPIHDPCYFLQFAEWAEECGLRYLAETDLGSMAAGDLAPAAQPILDSLAPSFLETQQWVDFAVNRSGRSSLLTRCDASPERSFSAEQLHPLEFGTLWSNVTPLNRAPDAPAVFESPQGRRIEVSNSNLERVLLRLSADTTEATAFAELLDVHAAPGASSVAGGSDRLQAFCHALAGMIAKGVIEPRSKI